MRNVIRLVYILALLILIDLTATLFWVANDLAVEANPFMDFFLQISPLLFVLAKLGLSGVGIWILYYFHKRFRKMVFRALLGLNLIYIAVFVYHLWGVLFLLVGTN